MDMWMKVGQAVLLIAMLVFIWPRAHEAMRNSPKGTASEWKSALIPLLLVAGFVVLLIMTV